MMEIGLELRQLCRAQYELAEPITVAGGPTGARVIGEVTHARFEGERFRASLLGRAAADWAVVEPDGRILADVRLTVQTDDGAVVLVRYLGRGDAATGVVFTAPRFKTGDERYAWLTRMQAVGKGIFDATSLRYEIFEVV
jgi:hypothetical protein